MTAEKPRSDLEDLLVNERMLTRDQLASAQAEQRRTGHSLGRVLIDLGMLKEAEFVSAIAQRLGLEFVDLTDYPIDAQAASLIPEQLARRYGALPVAFEGERIVVAMSDPGNVFALDDIRTVTGLRVKPVVASPNDIEAAIRKYGQFEQSVAEAATEAATEAKEDEREAEKIGAAVEEAPIVRLVNLLITRAVAERASDIHIEPSERDVRIRYRIDGVLHEVMRPQKSIQNGLISRLKVMAEINIAEHRVPQDGRIGLIVGGRSVDLRVATLPTVHGEKIVIRVLDKNSVLMRLEELGFLEAPYEEFEKAFRKPYGTVLVTGPTGSGKSTTLYATLNIVNTADRNIITVEDPVEYRLPGVNQIQVNPKAGLDFPRALRSILRADPDVILVGEIRDRETAVVAVEAALTGHLVLSTLHTNDAASAITRLIEMGVEPYLVASSLDCVVAQRLARKLCRRCRVAFEPSPAELQSAGFREELWPEIRRLYRPGGCAQCSKTGYHGRMGLYEVMPVTEDIERLAAERRAAEEIRRLARSEGMMTLAEDGLEKVRAGLTSVEEIYRVVV